MVKATLIRQESTKKFTNSHAQKEKKKEGKNEKNQEIRVKTNTQMGK